jgi:PAS domain S-box-containing protein
MEGKVGSTNNLNDKGKKEEMRGSGRPHQRGSGLDPTAIKRFEETLRTSESFLNSIMDQSPYPMWIADDQGTLVWLNQACRDLLYLEDDEVVGKYNILKDNIVEEQGLLPLVKRVFEEGDTVRFEIKYDSSHLKQLQVRHAAFVILDVTIFPIRDASGKIAYAMIQHLDITERKRAEEELSKEKMLTEALLESLPGNFFLIDAQGKHLRTNKSALAISGYTWEELSQAHALDFLAEEDRPAAQRAMEEVFDRGENSVEAQILTKDGRKIPFLFTGRKIILDGMPCMLGIGSDITERKQAEEGLRESEKKYRDLYQEFQGILNAIPDLLCLLTPDFKIVWSNEATVDAVQQRSAADLMGKFCYAIRHQYSEPCENCPVLRCFRSGQIETDERTGEGQTWELRAVPIYDDQGELLGAIELARNITERQQMHEALRESQALYQDLVETAQDLIWQCDSEGRYTYLNPAWEEVFGYKIEEMLGKPFSDFQPPEYAARDQQEFYRILEGGTVNKLETIHLAKDGRELHLVFNAKFVRDQDGYIAGTRGTAYNITERKKAEEGLRESEKKYRSLYQEFQGILNTIPDILCLLSPDLRIVWGNEATALAIPDSQLPDIIGKHCYPLRHERSEPCENCPVLRCFSSGKVETEEVVSFGDFYDLRAVPLYDDQGELRGAIEVARNITERKRMEEALERRLVALSRPLDDTEDIDFQDLFNLEDIQRIQDLFAESTGVGSLITTPDGTPITQPSNFCRLCRDFIRESELGRQKCALSDATIGRYNPDGPTVSSCLSAGLCNAGTSIIVGGKHIANWLIGQVRDDTQTEKNMRKYARELGLDAEEFIDAFLEVPIMPADHFRQVAQALFVFANQLSAMAYQNVQQARFITERKRMEEALRDSERRLSEIIDFLPDATFAIDLEGRVIAWNRAIEEMTGVKAEDIVGKGDYEYTVPFYGIRRPCLIDLIFIPNAEIEKKYVFVKKEGDILLAEAEVHLKGETQMVWAKARPLYDSEGKVVGAIEAIRDITEHKETLQALQESETRFRQAVEHSPLAIAILSGDQGEYLNPKFIETLGYTLEDIPTLPHWFRLAYPDPAYRQSIIDKWQKALAEAKAGEKAIKGLEVEVTCKDGSVRTMDICGVLVGSKILIFCNDLTERQLAEEERARLEGQMREVQKLESLGVLAGGIAHDFNNLLMAVLGNADLALTSLSPASPARPNVEEIVRASHRAADLCRQMLAYSGKGRFVVGRYDLSEVVQEMTQMLEVSVSKKATLRYSFGADLPAVEADATQLRQVIMNLIVNASEALGDQSGVISVSTGVIDCDRAYFSDSYLDENLPEGRYVFLEVTDTGAGMDEETRRRIFEPFFTTKFTGRGLGLAAVLGIVRGHHGAIKVYSEPGQGTNFKVLFPATAPAPEDQASRKTRREPPLSGGTILLVDDDAEVRKVGSQILKRLGFKVITAAHGREGLEVFRTSGDGIDGVILDLTMPEMGGEEVFRELRRLCQDVRVILSSGYSEQEVTKRFAGKKIAGFIQKPYTMKMLRETLERVFRAK